MKQLLITASSWKFILPAFIAFITCTYLFQPYQTQINAITGKESPIVDLRKNYDKAEIQDFFSSMGEEGRQIHKKVTGILDMIYPWAYGSFFILLSAFFLRKISPPNSHWIYLAFFPVLLMIIDYVENFNTLAMLEAFPDLDAQSVTEASQITAIKSLLN
ncbi:MAG: hypothetical protein AAF696_06380 [Bacteroidota bacterium]